MSRRNAPKNYAEHLRQANKNWQANPTKGLLKNETTKQPKTQDVGKQEDSKKSNKSDT